MAKKKSAIAATRAKVLNKKSNKVRRKRIRNQGKKLTQSQKRPASVQPTRQELVSSARAKLDAQELEQQQLAEVDATREDEEFLLAHEQKQWTETLSAMQLSTAKGKHLMPKQSRAPSDPAPPSEAEVSEDEDSGSELAEFEREPRSTAHWQAKRAAPLPVKTLTGDLVRRTEPLSAAPSLHKHAHEKRRELHEAGLEKAVVRREPTLLEAQVALAGLAQQMLQNPYAHIALLDEVHVYCTARSQRVRHAALLTEAALLQDVVPGYRVRPQSADEGGLSKEVLVVRRFETVLLRVYKRFLDTAIRTGRASDSRDVHAAARALTLVLQPASDFNERDRLVEAVVQLTARASDDTARTVCYEALCRLFAEDKEGGASLTAVKLIQRLVKARGVRVQPLLLRALLHLPLSKETTTPEEPVRKEDPNVRGSKQQAKKRIKQLKKQKKRQLLRSEQQQRKKQRRGDADEARLARDMEVADPTVAKTRRRRAHTAILEHLFAALFHALKGALSERRRAKLARGLSAEGSVLDAVLQALARFALLLNVDLVMELLECLKELLQRAADPKRDGAVLPARVSLQAINCVFRVLSGHRTALAVDMCGYYQHLYSLLWSFVPQQEQEHVPLLCETVRAMFVARRQLSLECVASFVQRLTALATSLGAPAASAVLSVVGELLGKYPLARRVLDGECRGGASLPLLDEPNLAGAFSSHAWGVVIHPHSHHPKLRGLSAPVLCSDHVFTPLEPLDGLDALMTATPPADTKTRAKKRAMRLRVAATGATEKPSAFVQTLARDATVPIELK